MIKFFAASLSLLFAFCVYSNDLILYYDGKLKLTTNEVDSICNHIIQEQSEGYLLALAYYQKGVLLRKGAKNLDAYDHYNHAFQFLQVADTTDSYLQSAILTNQGVILKQHGYLDEAIKKQEAALIPAHLYSTKWGLSVEYNLARAWAIKDPQRALTILFDILEKTATDNLASIRVEALNEIALIMLRSEEFTSAIDYLMKAESLAESKEVKALTFQNRAHAHAEMNELEQQEVWLKKSIDLGTHKYLFVSLMDMGICALEKGDTEGAKFYLSEAESYYAEQPLSLSNIVIFEHLATAFPSNNYYLRKLADEYKQLAEEKGMLEKMIKQQAMAQLLLRLEQDKRSKKKIDRYQVLAISGGIIALIILLTWRIWWYRLRKRLGKKIVHIVSRWETEEER